MKTKLCTLAFLAIVVSHGYAARIKDIVDVIGLRENTLIGMGVVVGLNNSGDKSEAVLKAVSNMLKKQKFNVSTADLSSGNVALVMVTANLPPLARKGSRIDVTVSSIGDARSLSGGVLLVTYLKALNQRVYAVAQGVLSQGGTNLPTVATVSNGAIVEREVPAVFITDSGELLLRLKSPDFNTANRIAEAIDFKFGHCSYAVDMGTVKIEVPASYLPENRLSRFIGEVFLLEVVPDTPARVVINERTGTVIIGSEVTISQVTIAHNQITVNITDNTAKGPVTVDRLVNTLISLRVSTRDMVAIFRMLKQAGALHAELIVE